MCGLWPVGAEGPGKPIGRGVGRGRDPRMASWWRAAGENAGKAAELESWIPVNPFYRDCWNWAGVHCGNPRPPHWPRLLPAPHLPIHIVGVYRQASFYIERMRGAASTKSFI